MDTEIRYAVRREGGWRNPTDVGSRRRAETLLVPGKRFEMPKELPGAVRNAVVKATASNETLQKLRREVVVHTASKPDAALNDKNQMDSGPADGK